MTAEAPGTRPRLAVLFWFYKDVEVCKNRLRLLRHFNTDIAVFGLYGGDADHLEDFRRQLAPMLDDFAACHVDRDPNWKWIFGDALLAEWYLQAGQNLAWDTIVVVQWDMLVFGSFRSSLSELREGELLLPGLRPIEEVLDWWNRVTRDREDYLAFVADLRARFDPSCPILACQFVFACLPRTFLDAYAKMDLSVGFLEYRLPTYAALMGFRFRSIPAFECWWPGDPSTRRTPARRRVTTTERVPRSLPLIGLNLILPRGARVFHPVYRTIPLDLRSAAGTLVSIIIGRLTRLVSLVKVRGRERRQP